MARSLAPISQKLSLLRSGVPVVSLSSDPTIPAFDYTPPSYEGISKSDVKRLRQAHVSAAVHRQTFYKDAPLFVQGKQQYLFDENGRRYLDLFGGICTVSVGHSHEKVGEAIKKQLDTLQHTSNVFLHPRLSEYSEAMIKKMPEDSNLKVVYFCNSGSEANDLAMLMARAYTGNLNIVGLRRAYHGASATNIALTAMPLYRKVDLPITNISQTMSPDVYRGIWGGDKCRDGPCQVATRTCDCGPEGCAAAENYAEQYRDHLMTLCPPGKGLAAFIAEGMGGMTAALQAPKGFYKKAFDITKEYEGVNIMDEVQTGFGRLGTHFWGFEYHGVRPDIITAAKSIGNGFPLAMCVTTPEISEAFADSGLHFNTFGGNAIAATAGLATLKAIDEDGLMENSRVVGDRLASGLNKLRQKYDIIGDCRGKGLFLAMEFVKTKSTNKPIPPYHLNAILERIKDLGILIGKGGVQVNCFRMQPPMCMTIADADFTLDVLDQVFEEYVNGKIDVEAFNPNK